jgi:putative RNA 2'-phosphotransferase
MTDEATATSKALAYALRHRPQSIGIELDPGGWVRVDALLAAFTANGRPISRQLLNRVVAGTDKRRFELEGDWIRAAQGHSVPVDLGLAPTPPPPVLYHGTVERFLSRIRAQGLIRGRRHHVHLSPDEPTALVVGRRREGRTVVLRIDAAGMHRQGYPFYEAANGVWLTDHVPPQWIDEVPGGEPGGQGGG